MGPFGDRSWPPLHLVHTRCKWCVHMFPSCPLGQCPYEGCRIHAPTRVHPGSPPIHGVPWDPSGPLRGGDTLRCRPKVPTLDVMSQVPTPYQHPWGPSTRRVAQGVWTCTCRCAQVSCTPHRGVALGVVGCMSCNTTMEVCTPRHNPSWNRARMGLEMGPKWDRDGFHEIVPTCETPDLRYPIWGGATLDTWILWGGITRSTGSWLSIGIL